MLFLIGQVLNAGNMNYQQVFGYYEINPLYGKHPSKFRVYVTKGIECLILLVLVMVLPKHAVWLLIVSNVVVWGFICYDRIKKIPFEFRW